MFNEVKDPCKLKTSFTAEPDKVAFRLERLDLFELVVLEQALVQDRAAPVSAAKFTTNDLAARLVSEVMTLGQDKVGLLGFEDPGNLLFTAVDVPTVFL